jgi:hypothetical protein
MSRSLTRSAVAWIASMRKLPPIEVVLVELGLAVVAQQLAGGRELVVVGGQEATVADAAHVLGRERRPAGAQPVAAGHAALAYFVPIACAASSISGTENFRQIDSTASTSKDGAEQVHRHHRLRPLAGLQRVLELLRVDVEPGRFDVDEHRLGADARDDAGGGEERIGRQHDLVAGPMPSAISGASRASVPDDIVSACLQPRYSCSSRSRFSTSGPRMYWPLRTTRTTAASTSASCALSRVRSMRGTGILGRPG